MQRHDSRLGLGVNPNPFSLNSNSLVWFCFLLDDGHPAGPRLQGRDRRGQDWLRKDVRIRAAHAGVRAQAGDLFLLLLLLLIVVVVVVVIVLLVVVFLTT